MDFRTKIDTMELAKYWKDKAEKAEKDGDILEAECCKRHSEYYRKIAAKQRDY